MVNDSNFQFDDDNQIKYTYSHNQHKRNGLAETTGIFTAKMIIERIEYDTSKQNNATQIMCAYIWAVLCM